MSKNGTKVIDAVRQLAAEKLPPAPEHMRARVGKRARTSCRRGLTFSSGGTFVAPDFLAVAATVEGTICCRDG